MLGCGFVYAPGVGAAGEKRGAGEAKAMRPAARVRVRVRVREATPPESRSWWVRRWGAHRRSEDEARRLHIPGDPLARLPPTRRSPPILTCMRASAPPAPIHRVGKQNTIGFASKGWLALIGGEAKREVCGGRRRSSGARFGCE